MSDKTNYTLIEISKWQKEVSNNENKITLPSLQRGFVWKPHQIENLWDSILRGYPIGSVLMSKDDKENRELLDGQQRCTSVALGFFNPFDENSPKEILNLKNYIPSIWIDLKPAKITDERKFIVKVLTKSHPWGFQTTRTNNGNFQTLQMHDRRNAKKAYFEKLGYNDEKSYLDLSPKDIFPWDAHFPFPLSWLLEMVESVENITTDIFFELLKEKMASLNIKAKYSADKVDYDLVTKEDIEPIFNGLLNSKKLTIPEIIVEAEILKNEIDNEDNQSKDNNESQNPTLFVRLNSGGTTLNGEELMYSVFKSMFPQVKELVENLGASYLSPSKIVSIFSRIVYVELNDYKTLPKNFNANSFKNEINKNKDFRDELINLIGKDDDKSYAKKLLEKAIEVIKQKKDLSPILIKNVITSNIDLFVVLLIYIHERGLDNLNETNSKDISANFVYMLWFSSDNKKIPSNLFKCLFTENLSWSDAAKKLIKEDLLLPLLDANTIKKYFDESFSKNQNYNENKNVVENLTLKYKEDLTDDKIIDTWNHLIGKIRGNNSILLYAQNDYLKEKFKEFNQFENLDDTNRPFDWDHIYPKSWVDRNVVNHLVRNWVNTIGNYRALSYDDNRSENNKHSPKQRLIKENNQIDLFKNNDNFFDDLNYWNKLEKNRIRNNEDTQDFLFAVSYRTLNIYKFWFDNYYNQP